MVRTTMIAAAACVLVSSVMLLGACSSDSVAARMARASQYFDNGKYRSATIELKNVLQSQPENARAWFTLGRVSLADGQYAEAAHQFRRARQFGSQQPNIDRLLAQALIGEGSFKEALEVLRPEAAGKAGIRAAMHALEGRAYLGLGKRQQAKQSFEAALAAQPNYSAALVGLSRVARLSGNAERARQLVARATSADPSNGRAWAVAGGLAFVQGRCDDVVTAFEHIRELDDSALPPVQVFRARAHVAHCQLQAGRFKQAAANIDVLLKTAPDHPYANYLKALLAYHNDNLEQATAHVQKALAAAPGSTSSTILLGMIKLRQGELKAAQFQFTEAVSEAPDNLRARQLLASVYIKRGLPERAVEVLQEVLETHGANPRVLAQLAEASLRAGQEEQGLQYVKLSARFADDNADLQLSLARRMAQAGNVGDALALLEQMEPRDQRDKLKAKLLEIALYLQNGQAEQAIAEARRLVQSNPDNVRYVRLLARVYLAAGDRAKARSTLQDALQSAPDNVNLHLDIGWLTLRSGDYQAAMAIFRSAVEAHPESVRALLSMAKVSARQGDIGQAITWLEKAAALRPRNLELQVTLVRAYLSQGRAQDAVPVAESITAIVPDNARAYRLQSAVLLAAGKPEAARASIEQAGQLAEDPLALRLGFARMLVKLGQFDAAIRQLQKIRELHPGSVEAASMLAELQYRQGDVQAAAATVNSLLDDGATSASAYVLKGDLMRAQGKYRAAAKAYAQAYAMQPSHDLALRLFEVRRRGQLPEPAQSLHDWLRQHPDDIAVMAALAQWYQVTGALESAIEQYRAILALDQSSAVALNNLAMLYFQQGNERALDLARQAYAAAPESPAIMDTLGWILLNKGNVSRALPLLRQAARAASGQPAIQYHLAVALARSGQSGQRAEAIDILNRLLASGQSFASRSEAKQLLDKLKKE